MAQVVNTDTSLGRRAAIHRVWLATLCVVGIALTVNLLRGVVGEMGGVQSIREAGLANAAAAAFPRVFHFTGWELPPPYTLRQLALLVLHLVGLGAIGQLVWLPLGVLRGHASERRVLRELQRLPDEYWVLSDLLVPGLRSVSQLDHVVVSPYGLWCIETKGHAGLIVGGEFDFEWRQLKPSGGRSDPANRFYNPVRQNSTHCAHLTDHLAQERLEAPVRSMIVFTSAEVDTMTMTPVERAGNFVQTILRTDVEKVLDHHKVERIVGALSSLLATKARRAVPRDAQPAPAPAAAGEPHRA